MFFLLWLILSVPQGSAVDIYFLYFHSEILALCFGVELGGVLNTPSTKTHGNQKGPRVNFILNLYVDNSPDLV